jgi:protein phosphatase
MTKDQTMAQAMIDAGVFSAHTAEESRLKHVLYSALGGSQANPDVLTADLQWDDLMLLCTDGLTKHVSDEQIQQELLIGGSAETMCRRLVDLALAGGGTDNVTVVIGRLKH